MSHTTLQNFQWANDRCFDRNLCPCPTQLYNGPIQWQLNPINWSPMGMTGSFGHVGVRNILIDIVGLSNTAGVTCHQGSVIPRLRDFGNPPAACGVTDSGTVEAGLKIRLACTPTCVLLAPNFVNRGTTARIQLVNAPAGKIYQMAASLSQGPPLPMQNCKVCLGFDSILITSVLFNPPVFNGYAGRVGATGTATGRFIPPRIPGRVGLCFYHAAIVIDPKQGVLCCSNTAGTQIW